MGGVLMKDIKKKPETITVKPKREFGTTIAKIEADQKIKESTERYRKAFK